MKKRAVKKEVDADNLRKKDKLSVAVFFASAYLSLNYLETSAWFYFSGVLFLICGLFGVISIFKKKKFIF